MPITPFAIILIAIYLFGFGLKKNLKNIYIYIMTITIAVTLYVRMGYFFRIGNFEMNYTSVLVYLLGLISLVLLLLKKGSISLKRIKWFIVFLLNLLVCYIGLSVVPYKESVIIGGWTNYIYARTATTAMISAKSVQIGYYLMFLFLGIIIIVSRRELDSKDWIRILSNVIKIGKMVICVGYLEWLIVNILHSKVITNVFIVFFGSAGIQQNELTKRGFLYTVQGATKEPSMFSTTIFYLCILLMLDLYNKPNKGKKRWLVGAILLLVINPAMSGFIYLSLLLVIAFTFGLLRRKQQGDTQSTIRFITIVSLAIIIIAVLWEGYQIFLSSSSYILNRVGVAFQQLHILVKGAGLGSYSSEGIRFTGIVYDMGLIIKRPLFGFGLGSLSCNSGIVTLLVNVGIFGFVAWIYMMFQHCEVTPKKNSEKLFLIEILIFPNVILNDYETILCLVIPFAAICYGYILRGKTNNEIIEARTK